MTTTTVAIFIAPRIYATAGSTIRTTPDTPSYFDFELWGATRFPVVTAFYALVADHRAIVTIQAVAGACAWVAAVIILGSLIPTSPHRQLFHVVAFGLGLTAGVTAWDATLLSESMSISLAVLVAALLIRFGSASSRLLLVSTVVAAGLWAFSRQNNAIVLGALAFGMLTFWALRRSSGRQFAVLGLSLLLLAGMAGVLASSNTGIQEANTTQVLARKILADSDHRAWFVDRGMPETEAVAVVSSSRVDNDALIFERRRILAADEEFRGWMASDGTATYLRFLASHPVYVVSALADDPAAVRGFVHGAKYATPRSVLPAQVGLLYWPRTPLSLFIVGLAVLVLCGVAARRALRSQRLPDGTSMAVLLLGVAVLNIALVAHSAGAEYGRLLSASSITARLVAIWLIVALLTLRPGGRRMVPESSAPASDAVAATSTGARP